MESNEERSSKRRRLNEAQRPQQDVIKNSGQLCTLLRAPIAKIAVNRFKDFLTSIVRSEGVAEQTKSLRILKEYCNTQAGRTNDELDFSDLLQSWSQAVESRDDSLCSAIPAVLAQFYKTISGILEFREFGLSLGQSLLKYEQIQLFSHGLSASKTREHLISPCLRLLTEIISFDGGSLSSRVFNRRDILFKRLDLLLDQPKIDLNTDRRRPTVRRMALRLLIAAFKFLDDGDKAELAQSRILRNCLRGLSNDGDDIVVDIIKALEAGLVENRQLSRGTKLRIFNFETLSGLSAQYDYEVDSNHPDSASKVRTATHDLLLKICTTKMGVVAPQNGWYPVAFETRLDQVIDDSYIDLGLDSPLYAGDHATNITVKNVTLSTFIQSLKPESDTLQSTLIIQILRSAPELVADFFNKKTKTFLPSSSDTTWRSQFGFLFSIIQLPVPRNFGYAGDELHSPPPVSIVIESLLPRPCEKTTLSRYFTSKDDILTLSASRLLTVALGKLQEVLKMFASRSNSREWVQASTQLSERMLERVPKVQEVVNSLLQAKEEDVSTRSALLECLASYYKFLPRATSGSRFDIGPILSEAISKYELLGAAVDLKLALSHDVYHIVEVAQLSSGTKWYSKFDSESMSLFGQLLKFSVTHTDDELASRLSDALRSVSRLAGVLSNDTTSLSALQQSVASAKEFEPGNETWLLLDNAIHRIVQSPVRYLDQIEDVQYSVSDQKPLSLLSVAVREQWGSFALKKYAGQKDVLTNIAKWIVRLYSALDSIGENFRVLQQFQQDMLQLAEGTAKEILQEALDEGRKNPIVVQLTSTAQTDDSDNEKPQQIARSIDLTTTLGSPAGIPDSLENIDSWNDKTDIELALQSGKVAKLCRLAASKHEEIRRKTFQDLQRLMYIVEESNHDEKIQLHLLLGELVETVRQHGLETSLPSFAAELAALLLDVVADPAHEMYGKMNKFLLRSPRWETKRLLTYWLGNTIFQEPETDDAGAWEREVEWLVRWLISGLQSGVDIELYRRSGVYEKVLVIFMKPNLSRTIKKLILTLIWRGICVDGSQTLVTRAGIKDFLLVAGNLDKNHSHIIQQLGKEINDRCDAEQIKMWQEDLPALRGQSV